MGELLPKNSVVTYVKGLALTIFLCGLAVSLEGGTPRNDRGAAGGGAPNGHYRQHMLRGQAKLEDSYATAASADQKAKDATELRAKWCKIEMSVPKNTVEDANEQAIADRKRQLNNDADQLIDESRKLSDKARASAIEALEQFKLAEMEAPDRSEPIFGEGLALAQLKDYCGAIRKFETVRKQNYETPETTFALGNALVNSSDVGSTELQRGIQLLDIYVSQARASNRPEAFPNLTIAEALSQKAKAKPKETSDKHDERDEEPNFASCPQPPPPTTELPFNASVVSAIGYNNNVTALGRGLPLPASLKQKDSFYNESSIAISKDWSLSHPSSTSNTGWLGDKLSLNYVFTADTFAEFDERDRMLQTVLGSYQRSFTPHVAGLVKLSEQLLSIDQSIASNLFTAQEALVLSPNTRLKTLASYYLIRIDSFATTAPAADPDGFTHRAELTQIMVLKQDKDDFSNVLTLTGQYAHEWTLTNGVEGRFQRNELFGKVEWKPFHARTPCSFIRGVVFSVSDRWQPDEYSHATFSSTTDMRRFARSEDTNIAAFAISITMWYDQNMKNAGLPDANRLEAIFDYRHTTRESNVGSKTYDQDLCLASLKLNF